MYKILSFLLIFFVYNNALIAMDNKPYHHLPDGTFRKILDTSHLNSLGWKSKTSLDAGLKKTISEFIDLYSDTL